MKTIFGSCMYWSDVSFGCDVYCKIRCIYCLLVSYRSFIVLRTSCLCLDLLFESINFSAKPLQWLPLQNGLESILQLVCDLFLIYLMVNYMWKSVRSLQRNLDTKQRIYVHALQTMLLSRLGKLYSVWGCVQHSSSTWWSTSALTTRYSTSL